jgi:hypothetical protein
VTTDVLTPPPARLPPGLTIYTKDSPLALQVSRMLYVGRLHNTAHRTRLFGHTMRHGSRPAGFRVQVRMFYMWEVYTTALTRV